MPVGLAFDLDKDVVGAALQDNNLEEAAVWIVSTGPDKCEIRAPALHLIVPLLTRVPQYVKLRQVLWEM